MEPYNKRLHTCFLFTHCRKEIVQAMQTGPYSICTDGSNDNSVKKMYPITVAVEINGVIVNRFLDMCMGTSGTAEGKFLYVMPLLSTSMISIKIASCDPCDVANFTLHETSNCLTSTHNTFCFSHVHKSDGRVDKVGNTSVQLHSTRR